MWMLHNKTPTVRGLYALMNDSQVMGVSGLGELAAASKVTYPLVALSRTKLIYEYSCLRKNLKKRNQRIEIKTKTKNKNT